MADKLVGEGFLSYDELSVIEPDALMEMGELTEDQVNEIVTLAEERAMEAEAAATAEERRRQREQQKIDQATRDLEEREGKLPEPPADLGGDASGAGASGGGPS